MGLNQNGQERSYHKVGIKHPDQFFPLLSHTPLADLLLQAGVARTTTAAAKSGF